MESAEDNRVTLRRGGSGVSTAKLDTLIHDVPSDWARRAHADAAKYGSMYASSVSAPETFWAEHGKRIDWIKPFTKVKNTSFEPGNVSIKWFEDGTTNVSMNCIDRHLAKRADQVAIIWEGDDPAESRHITYAQLHDQVCRFANVLKKSRSEEGRHGHDLSADDPGSGVCHAGLRADRGGPFHRVRRLLAGCAGWAHRGLQVQSRHHRG